MEPRLTTFYVDKLDPVALADLSQPMGSAPFGVILDGGLDQFEANVSCHAPLHHRLRPGGVYIIEDIYLDAPNVERFKTYFRHPVPPTGFSRGMRLAVRHPAGR